ncbi:sugar 3,4-ketoisomerase [Prosthecobacter sp.]|jgi:UDP-2-acetamido-3-amino-2,3-dideoxy-glucuronate N-acetyltransferase|uniref:sugar 3,4-ketoisomerase n=1 Tax=Prosthecobacter sp. TaxID=1965333 RepID=UPI0037852A48
MIREAIIETCSVRGVRLHELRHVQDHDRGHLAVVDFAQELPFQPQRCFFTYAIPDDQTRGEHAHRLCGQFLICTHGECHLRVDDGENREEFCLNRPTFGVLVPPMIWATTHLHSQDSVLMVLASQAYEPQDYIRDYQDFLREVKRVNERL